MNRFRVISLFALAAIAALALADGIILKKTAKVGDVVKYHTNATFNIQGQDGNLDADSAEKVTDVDKDGNVSIETSTTGVKFSFAGNTTDVPDQPATSVKYSPSGEPLEMTGDQEGNTGHRIECVTMVQLPDKPLNAGDTWDFSKTDTSKGFVKLKANYTYVGPEKVGDVDAYKVKVSTLESEGDTPAKGEGFVWLDTKTGWIVKSDMQISNFPTPQGPIDTHVVTTRKDG
jgi:hypothetical protein